MVNDRSKAHAGDAASQDRNGTPVSRHEREKVFYTVQDLRELVEEIPNPSVALQAILRDFVSFYPHYHLTSLLLELSPALFRYASLFFPLNL